MTETEKKLLQAQHRLEEAQARNRVKERKARTRRLIQEDAILEKVLPEVRAMELSALEDYLMQKLPQPPDNATSTCWVLLSSSAQTANSLQRAQRIEGRNSLSLLPPACANLPPAALPQRWTFCPSIFSFTKEKQKKENEVNERWQYTIWKQRWSTGARGAPPWPLPLI